MASTLVAAPPKLASIMETLESYKQHLDGLREIERTQGKGVLDKGEMLAYRILPRAIHELYEAACVDFPAFKVDLGRTIGVQHGASEEQRTRFREIDDYIDDLHLKRKQYSSK